MSLQWNYRFLGSNRTNGEHFDDENCISGPTACRAPRSQREHANRLTAVSGPGGNVSYRYNGLGDRLETTANGGAPTRYSLDLAAGLTQVLQDGEFSYLYGQGRIAQSGANGTEYFLGDDLGSVRQLVDTGAWR